MITMSVKHKIDTGAHRRAICIPAHLAEEAMRHTIMRLNQEHRMYQFYSAVNMAVYFDHAALD